MTTILVAEDDPKTCAILKAYLESEGFEVLLAHTGTEALAYARQERPALVLLDLILPEIDGLTVCRTLRAESNVPVILLTALSTESDILTGLDMGADDYITKPFSPSVMVARVKMVLRRAQAVTFSRDTLHVGPLVIDPAAYTVTVDDAPVPLTASEFKLLLLLVRHPRQVFTRADLLAHLDAQRSSPRTVDFHMMNLRRKIEPDPDNPRFLQTVYGVGYKFTPPQRPAAPQSPS